MAKDVEKVSGYRRQQYPRALDGDALRGAVKAVIVGGTVLIIAVGATLFAACHSDEILRLYHTLVAPNAPHATRAAPAQLGQIAY